MKAKKFKFIVIDDKRKTTESGWLNVFETFITPYGYLERILDSYPDQAYDNNSYSMNYVIYAPDTEQTFDKAWKHLRENQNDYDFYLIDLKMDDHNFKPGPPYVLRPIDKLASGERSLYVAGLYLLSVIDYNEKPKIFFSGASETNQLMLYYRFFEGRLNDTILGKIESETYKRKIETFIDTYLRQRQIQVIDSQPIYLRKELKDRLCEHSGLWDKADIPDDGTEESRRNRSECWSLRTLFPKQINKMENGRDADVMKQYIVDILDRDWRKLMWADEEVGGFLCHPKFGERLRDAQKSVRSLDFRLGSQKVSHYKKLTDLSAFNNGADEADALRDLVLMAGEDEYKIGYRHNRNDKAEPQSVIDYFCKIDKIEPTRNWYRLWRNLCEFFGIYPVDIAYISDIAFHNRRHLPGEPLPSFSCSYRLELKGKVNSVDFMWSYDTFPPPEEILNKALRARDKLKQLEDPNNDPRELSDSGFSDIGKIICGRYRGTVEFRTGKYCVRASRNGRIRVEFLDYCKELPKTQLKVTIEKPL